MKARFLRDGCVLAYTMRLEPEAANEKTQLLVLSKAIKSGTHRLAVGGSFLSQATKGSWLDLVLQENEPAPEKPPQDKSVRDRVYAILSNGPSCPTGTDVMELLADEIDQLKASMKGS